MNNVLDFTRLSNMVDALAGRKLVAIASTLTTSAGYLSGLISQVNTHAETAAASASTAVASASDADSAAASSLTVLNQFTSTYLGIRTSDPLLSSLGNPIPVGGWYIRSSDGRLRYCTSLNGSGNPIFSDATVSADSGSIVSAAQAYFLALTSSTLRTVTGPVTFTGTLLAPRVTNWSSQQVVTALDLNDRLTTTGGSVTAETTRAQAAETALDAAKVNRAGDTMTGILSVQSTGETPSINVINTTASTGRSWRIHSDNTGRFRVVDNTASAERLVIANNGTVTIPNSLVVSANAVLTELIINRADSNDPGMVLQQAGVSRWAFRRSGSAGRLYVSRYNSSGVYIDSPWYINESDGSIVQNATTINGAVSAKNTVRVDGAGSSLLINNTAGSNDVSLIIQNLGYTRWTVGRPGGSPAFSVMRFNDTGVYQDTPISVSESTGAVTTGQLSVNGTLNASGVVTTPTIYTTSNNAGTNVKIGDDAWIGDVGVTNALGVRGQQNFNEGFVVFGNNTAKLGCNAADPTLRYNGAVVVDENNIGTYLGAQITSGSNANGWWVQYPGGFVIQGGKYRGSMSSSNTYTITLAKPLATGSVPLSVLITPYDPSASYRQVHPARGEATNTTFDVRIIADDSGGSTIPGVDWLVHGFV